MYIHAYQSLIWNEIASKRVAKFGLNLCAGDLVYAGVAQPDETLDDAIEAEPEECPLDAHESSAGNESDTSEFRAKVQPLTEDDIKSNKYTIFDVVLPLPGHDITYPSNECSRWYEVRLLQDDLSSAKLKLKQKWVAKMWLTLFFRKCRLLLLKSVYPFLSRVYSLAGAYRKLLVKPDNVNWYTMKYNQDSDPLIRSDMEAIRGSSEPVSLDDGLMKALILELSLPPSSYATMALREITKSDTSTAYQIQLQTSLNVNSNVERDSTNEDTSPDAKKPRIE